jgi:hypothetical protein
MFPGQPGESATPLQAGNPNYPQPPSADLASSLLRVKSLIKVPDRLFEEIGPS